MTEPKFLNSQNVDLIVKSVIPPQNPESYNFLQWCDTTKLTIITLSIWAIILTILLVAAIYE